MIDPAVKRCLGQLIGEVHVVAATHDGVTRAHCSHWVTQMSIRDQLPARLGGHDDSPMVVT